MQSFQINFNGFPPSIVIPAGVLLLAYAWYYYRSTVPPVAGWLRQTLRAVRMLAVLLTVLLLMRPAVTLVTQETVLPVVAVLADDSQSMRITDGGVSRAAVLRDALRTMAGWPVFRGNARLKLFRFSAGLDTLSGRGADTLRFDGDATNIGDNAALLGQRSVKENIRAAVILSDGAANAGMFPETAAKGAGFPVHTVGIGDSTPVTDLAVTAVTCNEVAYRNTAVPVKVTVTSNGYAGRRIMVRITGDGRTVAQSVLTLGDDRQEQEVNLQLQPDSVGIRRYLVALPVLQGEKITRNNRAVFPVRVLKDRLNVLMISGFPGYDTKFVKKALDDDPSVKVELRYAQPGGTFGGGALPATDAALEPFDLVVLQDVPASLLPRAAADAVIRAVRQHGKGLLVLAGEQSCVNEDFSVSPLQQLLPVKYGNDVPRAFIRDFQPSLTAAGERHQVTALDDDPARNTELWRNIPPFAAVVKPRGVAEGSIVLATHPSYKYPGGGYAPVTALARAGAGRVMQVCAFPLWRWRFSLVPTDPAAAETYDAFMGNAIRWLLAADGNKLFRIKPGKRMYRAGETVQVEAQLYDSQYRPRDGAAVEAAIVNAGFERRVVLEPGGEPGIYRADLTGIPSGSYRLTGSAAVKGAAVGADTGKVYIDDHSLEFDDIRMRADVLRRTATAGNGTFVPADRLGDLEKELAFTPEQVEKRRQWEPWNSWVLMGVIIALLCGEWAVRKRKGML